MNTKRILQYLEDVYPEVLKADGFDDAIIGIAEGWFGDSQHAVLAYDYDKCIDILVAQGSTREEADEYFSFNTLGAYVGEHTPVFIHNLRGKK